MGCGSSKVFVANNTVIGQDDSAMNAFRLLELTTDDVNKLYRSFRSIDLSGNGTIQIDEFLASLELGKMIYIDIV